jgi:predicted aspartyl protease
VKNSICQLLYLWLIALSIPLSSAAQQYPAAESSAANLGMQFQLYSGYLIVVEGRIDSLKGLKFVLDTGTTRSILSKKIADKLALLRHPAQLQNFDKTVPLESATVSEVQFGPVDALNKEMSIMNLGKFSEYASHIDAVIGLDLLQLNNLTFDYNLRRVLFEPIDSNIQGAQKGLEPMCFTVKINVQGHLIRLILDTGVEGVLLYEDRVRAQVPRLRVDAGIKNVTIGGRMSGKLATLPEMHLGETLMDGRVLLIKSPPVDKIDGIDGCIGIALFHATRITFNSALKTIRWE